MGGNRSIDIKQLAKSAHRELTQKRCWVSGSVTHLCNAICYLHLFWILNYEQSNTFRIFFIIIINATKHMYVQPHYETKRLKCKKLLRLNRLRVLFQQVLSISLVMLWKGEQWEGRPGRGRFLLYSLTTPSQPLLCAALPVSHSCRLRQTGRSGQGE